MKEKIRSHVEELFTNAPKTKRAYDLKEELISDLEEKYNDLVKEGKTEEQAYANVVSGIGDIDELIKALGTNNPMDTDSTIARRKKNGLIVSICVGIYILSLISCIVLDELGLPDFVMASSFFTLAGLATCILIYHFMSQPKYIKDDDTIVEEFKEWKSMKSKDVEIKKAVNSTIWMLIVVIYFIISFMFMAWAYSWIIFLVGAAITQIVDLCFKLKE